MGTDVAEAGHNRRLTRTEAAGFFLVAWVASGAVPATGFWLAWGDERLVRTTLTTGLMVAGLWSCVLVGTRLRSSPDRHAAGGSPPPPTAWHWWRGVREPRRGEPSATADAAPNSTGHRAASFGVNAPGMREMLMNWRLTVAAVAAACCVVAAGCPGPSSPRPVAVGTLERVTVWNKPVQRPGETGENTGGSPPKGSRVEVYDQFILVTPPDGPTVLSPHGWYTDLTFRRDPSR